MTPLSGLKLVEFAGIGPAPHAGMLLSDMGMDVICIDRPSRPEGLALIKPQYDIPRRNRRSIALDLKQPEGVEVALQLIESADATIEGLRPGAMERLGLGPQECMQRNPRLVYGRMTGWGQEGPLAQDAGHDINYIGIAGALHYIGTRNGPPIPPLSFLGDFGGGGTFLAFGVVCALLEAKGSGQGQVVDAAIVDGVSLIAATARGVRHSGGLSDVRGTNSSDGSRPYYSVYETKDGGYMAVGAVESKFYANFVQRLGLGDVDLPKQHDRDAWDSLRERFASVFLTKTRAEWEQIFNGSDECVTPVLNFSESEQHPHARARDMFVMLEGVAHPAPAPRLSRTKAELRSAPPQPGQHTRELLSEVNLSVREIDSLIKRKIAFQA